jgi:hypothetical protein
VDAFHAAAIEAGGTDNGAPGVRAIYHADYYGGYVLDPDGNNIEAVCHQPGWERRLRQRSAVHPDDRPPWRAAKVSDTELPVSVMSAISGVRHQLARLRQ